jgi:DNA polymerase V
VPIAEAVQRAAAALTQRGDIGALYAVMAETAATVPLMAWRVPCGFPSPAEDYVERPLDFNDLLIAHPAATFAVRVEGNSMTGAGIFPGDIAVVDRAVTPANNSVILALLDGAFTIKRYRCRGEARWLQAENPAYPDLPLTEASAFEVWGVVTKSIRMLS